MSMHSFISVWQRSVSLAAFSVLVALIALLLALSSFSSAFASVHDAPESQQDVARSGVSVVRLLATYVQVTPEGQSEATASMTLCTGLGVLVRSWPSRDANDQNNWVLTEGNLVNPGNKATCVSDQESEQPDVKLISIQIYLSSAYNANAQTLPPMTITTSPGGFDKKIRCSNNPCNEGLAVFSFQTSAANTLPFIDIAQGDTTQETAVALTRSAIDTSVPPDSMVDARKIADYQSAVPQFLTPTRQQINASKEAGAPIVNNNGELAGMSLTSGQRLNADGIASFLGGLNELKNPPANTLHDDWNTGITNYYQKKFPEAETAFKKVSQRNSQFQGAQVFEQTAKNAAAAASGENDRGATGANNPPAQSPLSATGTLYGIPIWLLSVIALVLLVLLLTVVSLIFGRSRLRQRTLNAEYAEAERRAAIDAQQIAEVEARQQQAWSQPPVQMPQNAVPAGGAVKTTPLPGQELHCPRCGEPILAGANYCSNCRLLLSPSESGLHLRIASPTPSSAPARSAGSVADQPTIVPSRSIADQPTLVPAGSFAEQPTVDMLQNTSLNGESTDPFGGQRWNAYNLSVVAGTHSDPGIKRKLKPNEDSLFAAHSVRTIDSKTVQVGIFVVADGMGGHANGQDASRRAIQSFVDFMLPKLMGGIDLHDDALSRLMAESVQQANHAVHSHNLELGADMGTTITAALVVNATAYVSNVGDSRTYLYRESDGLKKVTNDHSVVASLVEAGIIKPDDIYTHPKRNQIYRSLGEKPVVDVDTFTVQLHPGDTLMLCSDGLWDMVRDPKIEEVIKKVYPQPAKIAHDLVDAALQGGGEDNVSVVVASLVEAVPQDLKPNFQLIAKPETVQVPQYS